MATGFPPCPQIGGTVERDRFGIEAVPFEGLAVTDQRRTITEPYPTEVRPLQICEVDNRSVRKLLDVFTWSQSVLRARALL